VAEACTAVFVVMSFVFHYCLGCVFEVVHTTGYMFCIVGGEYLRSSAYGCVLAFSLCVCVLHLGV